MSNDIDFSGLSTDKGSITPEEMERAKEWFRKSLGLTKRPEERENGKGTSKQKARASG